MERMIFRSPDDMCAIAPVDGLVKQPYISKRTMILRGHLKLSVMGRKEALKRAPSLASRWEKV
jgi:hypothetical protein